MPSSSSASTYSSFMQPTSPVGEDNRRKATYGGDSWSTYSSFSPGNQFDMPGMFSPAPNQVSGPMPRNAAPSLSSITNPSASFSAFGLGSKPPPGRGNLFSLLTQKGSGTGGTNQLFSLWRELLAFTPNFQRFSNGI